MNRTTEGLDWIKSLNGTEWKVIMYLLERCDSMTQRVIISKKTRQIICESLKITRQYFYNVTASLEKKNFIRKESPSDYLINPDYFYKGGTGNLKEKRFRYAGVNPANNE
jgi:hypothetical protein